MKAEMSMDSIVGTGVAWGGKWVVPSDPEEARPAYLSGRAGTEVLALTCLISCLLLSVTFATSLRSFDDDCQRPFEAFLYTDQAPGEARAHLDQVLVCFEARGLTQGQLPSLLTPRTQDLGAFYRSLRITRLAFPADPRNASAADAWLRTVQGASAGPVRERMSLPDAWCLGALTPLFQVWVILFSGLSVFLLPRAFPGVGRSR